MWSVEATLRRLSASRNTTQVFPDNTFSPNHILHVSGKEDYSKTKASDFAQNKDVCDSENTCLNVQK